MVQYVFTPWRDRPELLLVRQQFYQDVHSSASTPCHPQDDQLKHQAVARVSMWMQRGNCPHMVESTALLTAAVLNDAATATNSAGSSTYAIRAAYAAAFSRFVTGLLDGHQDKLRKQSMYSIAKTIGLPATFVELRHQATHEQLPSLAKLRSAAQKALSWIWNYYWKHLSGNDNREQSEADKADVRRDAVMRYLREDDGEEKQMIMRLLRSWDSSLVLKTISELQKTLPGNQVYLKCLKLSKEIMLHDQAESSVATTEQPLPDDIFQANNKLQEDVNNTETDVVDLDKDSATGWRLYQGNWKPKPIGIV